MKTNDKSDDLDPKHRVKELKLLFRRVTSGLSQHIEALNGQLTKEDATELRAEIQKLEGVHLTLAKAEEAFHEKFKDNDADLGPDYDAIRDQIGRALDRIRTNPDPSCVPEEFE